MREILFRGKTRHNDWIYGSLDQSQQTGKDEILIRTHDLELWWNSRSVIPETVGQFCGLLDKNGVKIFEGDVIEVFENDGYGGKRYKSVIEFKRGCFSNIPKESKHGKHDAWDTIGYNIPITFEVIGNIHNNPNLLEN